MTSDALDRPHLEDFPTEGELMLAQAVDSAQPHEALAVFLGDWYAVGTTYGGAEQSPSNPRAGASPWHSIHSAHWQSGQYFIVQDERANGPFDTLCLMGWDIEDERYFCRSVENHGYARDYTMTLDGRRWTLTGERERATYRFSEDGRTQEISWEWKPADHWLPLCDRTAERVD